MDTTLTPTTDLVVLDEPTTTDISDNGGTSTMPLIGAALIGGALIGKFVVPPVVGFVRGWFSKSDTEIAPVEEIVTAPETPVKKAV